MKHEFFDAVYSGSIRRLDGQLYRDRTTFSLLEYSGHVHLERIKALEEKRGFGSLCMTWLAALCDEHHVIMRTMPAQSFTNWNHAPGTNPQEKLEEWYSRFGFESVGNYVWERKPLPLSSSHAQALLSAE